MSEAPRHAADPQRNHRRPRAQPRREGTGRPPKPPTTQQTRFERIALVLQGGGALGAYQVGTYQALDEAGFRPDWVAGISIGSINAAIIAGNPPEERLGKLREFWHDVAKPSPIPWWPALATIRPAHNLVSAWRTAVGGHPRLFRRRWLAPWLAAAGTSAALSFYDPAPLRTRLQRLVDFERINDGATRLSLGAVNVRTGQLRYFDSTRERIGVEHVLAATALPPAFPPVRIDDAYWWDGGIYSNTPLDAVLDDEPQVDTLCFMVQLFTPDGPLPRRIEEVLTRHKDITYASRADRSIDNYKEKHDLRRAVDALCRRLPPDQQNDSRVQALWRLGATTTMSIVRLRHRARSYELESKDYEFSRLTIDEHLREGYQNTCRHCHWLQQIALRPYSDLPVGVFVHDPELEDPQATAEAAPREEQSAEGTPPPPAADSRSASSGERHAPAT